MKLTASSLLKSLGILHSAWQRFDSANGWAKASHVAMSTMLALFPFSIFTLSLAGQSSSEQGIDRLIEFVFGAWPTAIAEPVTTELYAVLEQSSTGTTLIGGAIAIWFASNGIDAARNVVAEAFLERDPRSFWRQRLACILFVVAAAILLAVVGTLVVVLSDLSWIAPTPPWAATGMPFEEILRNGVAGAFLFFSVYICHAWLPGVRHSLREVLPGVIMTLFLWGIAGYGFAVYFENFSSYSLTYAGLAGAMAALVFLYLMAAIFVFCAEVNGRLLATSQENEKESQQ